MAQTPQSGESGGADGTTAPGAGGPQGLFGSSTTILLIIFAVAVFWWSRRRRVEMEERLRAQRREAEATAERSALDVAHLMRAAPQPGAAAAASREGLASAVGPAAAKDLEQFGGGKAETPTSSGTGEPGLRRAFDSEAHDEEEARAMERAEARAAAERAAEEQAARASREAEVAGESPVRRSAAATAAAAEAEADTADAERAGLLAAVPADAVAGDGTAMCPPDYPIKGNRQSRIYHRPGQSSYAATIAEFCFASEQAAEAAGFRASRARGQRVQ